MAVSKNKSSKKKNTVEKTQSKKIVNASQKNTSLKKETKKTFKKEKQNKKKIFIIIGISIICLLLGISYSFFNYTRIGGSNEMVVGDIYMHYSTNSLSLTDALPRDSLDSSKYIEFTIDGLNEYTSQDIWYGIDILYGDIPNGKTESNRIRDDLLRFTLTKSINDGPEQVVVNNSGYENINNLRMYVEAIPAGTLSEMTHTYKLYMWISDEINVGNIENADYSVSEWNDLFASIKIRVLGDFIPKGSVNSLRVSFDANGGSVSVPYKYYNEGDVYGELPTATRVGYAFEGWRAANNVKVHSNKELQYNENHTLTAVWSIVKYQYNGEYTFTGSNYIDTEVSLFNEENAHRNFYISFDISNYGGGSNNSNATAISSQMAVNPKYGFIFSRNGTNSQFKMASNGASNGNVDSYSRTNIYYGNQNVKIIRINDIMYYSLNDGGFTKCGDYTGFSSYFNTPVTFGATLNSNGNPKDYFKGKLSNMMIKIIVGDDVSLDDFLYSTNNFEYEGDFEFNGSTAINTGVYLFNEANAERSFYISFDIKSINWNVSQSTLMSSKDESGPPWAGFELRRSGTSNVYFQSKATVASGNANDANKIPISTKNIRFLRVNNGKTNILYYSLDGGDFVLHNDFTSFNLYFSVPVVFGNAYNVETQRYFKGTLSNMVVKFISNSEALEICGSTCS